MDLPSQEFGILYMIGVQPYFLISSDCKNDAQLHYTTHTPKPKKSCLLYPVFVSKDMCFFYIFQSPDEQVKLIPVRVLQHMFCQR